MPYALPPHVPLAPQRHALSRRLFLPCCARRLPTPARLAPRLSRSKLTVADAINAIIMPLTLSPRSSLTGALSRRAAADESGALLTGAANVYVVYSDKMLLDDLLDAIEAHAAKQEKLEDVYVWLSLFCDNYHRTAEEPLIWHQSTFKTGLKAIGHTCMLAAPWDEPMPLKRSWCLMELQISIAVGNKLTFELGDKEAAVLDQCLLDDMENVLKKLEAGGASGWRKGAETTIEHQKAAVDGAIARAEGGEVAER
eukprot:3812903-Prymnesium_polylepis.1